MKTIGWQDLAVEAAEVLIKWGLEKITSGEKK